MTKSVIADYGAMVYLRRNLQLCASALQKYDDATAGDEKAIHLAAAKHQGLVCVKLLKGIRPKIQRMLSVTNYAYAVTEYCAPSTSVFGSISDEEVAACLAQFCSGDVIAEVDTFIRGFEV